LADALREHVAYGVQQIHRRERHFHHVAHGTEGTFGQAGCTFRDVADDVGNSMSNVADGICDITKDRHDHSPGSWALGWKIAPFACYSAARHSPRFLDARAAFAFTFALLTN
jgi:hypothetical protein